MHVNDSDHYISVKGTTKLKRKEKTGYLFDKEKYRTKSGILGVKT